MAKNPQQDDLAGLLAQPADQRIPIKNTDLLEQLRVAGAVKQCIEELARLQWARELAGMKVAINALELRHTKLLAGLYQDSVREVARAGIDLSAWQVMAYDGEAIVVRPYPEVPADMREEGHGGD